MPRRAAETLSGYTRRMATVSVVLAGFVAFLHLYFLVLEMFLWATPFGQKTFKRSAAEQGADVDPEVIAELMRLNADYEARHGFRFCVFVDRRPKREILDVLRSRLDNPTGVELETALDELVAIAEDRWRRG